MRAFFRIVLPCIALTLVAASFLLPRFFDPTALRDSLTAQLSTALGRQVEIERLEVQLLPEPAIVVHELKTTLTDHRDDQVRLGRIAATVSIAALLEGQILISRLDIEHLALNPHLVDTLRMTLAALNRGTSGSAIAVRLRQAQIDGFFWTTASKQRLGPYRAVLNWTDDQFPSHVAISQPEGQLEADWRFDGKDVEMHLQASAWTMPMHPPLRQALKISALKAHARYTDRRLELLDMHFSGPAGILQLRGALEWRDAWRFSGRLNGERVDLPLLLTTFGQPAVAGQVTGECDFDLRADLASALLRNPRLDCDVRHAKDGRTAKLAVITRPQADLLRYELRATDFQMPIGPPLHFDTLDLRGALANGKITFDAAHATGYAGELDLPGSLSWRAGWRWEFAAQAKRLQLAPLLAVFNQHKLDGRLDAACEGKLTGTSFSALFEQPRLQCDFAIADGVLRNADLEQAARFFKTASKHAGTTPFDQLSGRLLMHSGQSQFTGLKLRSTALEASGAVTVAPDKRLSGEVNAGLKNTGGMISVPLVVSGVVGEPVIRPTTSAMAGGAAGTVLLGPGLGTAVGVKVGEAFGKMTRWLKPKGEGHGASPQE